MLKTAVRLLQVIEGLYKPSPDEVPRLAEAAKLIKLYLAFLRAARDMLPGEWASEEERFRRYAEARGPRLRGPRRAGARRRRLEGREEALREGVQSYSCGALHCYAEAGRPNSGPLHPSIPRLGPSTWMERRSSGITPRSPSSKG